MFIPNCDAQYGNENKLDVFKQPENNKAEIGYHQHWISQTNKRKYPYLMRIVIRNKVTHKQC